MCILVTGGAGFIGSNFILEWMEHHGEQVINIDKLTYAGNKENLTSLANNANYKFIHGDISNSDLIQNLMKKYQPRSIVHFAAESHVDRSIADPSNFINTNIVGTFSLLETVRKFWQNSDEGYRTAFRFLHISTDEVYGSLDASAPAFRETSPFAPNSPYSASKAASDHLVRAYYHTYGLPVITTHCSNNYGPYQFPEKLIPLIIHNALAGKSLPIYGDGKQIRDWLYVKDHCAALRCVLTSGRIGETYNIGGWNERTNIDVVMTLCDLLAQLKPRKDGKPYTGQMTFVKDRPGHDQRYALNAAKIESELGWKPQETFETGIYKTLCWYLENPNWVDHISTGSYRHWIEQHYQA